MNRRNVPIIRQKASIIRDKALRRSFCEKINNAKIFDLSMIDFGNLMFKDYCVKSP